MSTPRGSETTVSICTLTTPVYLDRIDELITLHLAAMGYGVGSFGHRRRLWATNSGNPGFIAMAAIEHPITTDPDINDRRHRIVGVAYGFPGHPSSWWYHEVHRGLRNSGLTASDATEKLSDYDEVSEVHVFPEFQGQGIGRRMLSELLLRLKRPIAMLSTPEVAGERNAAWTLYRDLGFHDILRGFRFTSDPRPFGILGHTRNSGDVA